MGRTIFGQVFVRGGMSNFQNPKVPPTGGQARRNSFHLALTLGPANILNRQIGG